MKNHTCVLCVMARDINWNLENIRILTDALEDDFKQVQYIFVENDSVDGTLDSLKRNYGDKLSSSLS